MIKTLISRRAALFGGLSLSFAAPRMALARGAVELDWSDLMPEGEQTVPPALQGLVPHDESAAPSSQPPSSGVRTDWNGEIVRLSGFIIPLDYAGTGITAFMLVPYVGACIHVPPPPANQLVLVTTDTPYQNDGLFEAVTVEGLFSTASTATELADVGYAMSASRITRFRP